MTDRRLVGQKWATKLCCTRTTSRPIPRGAEVKEMCASLRQESTSLAEEIRKGQAAAPDADLDSVKEKKDIDKRIASCMAVISPILRLPDDILYEIFLATTGGQPSNIIHPGEQPVILTAVCREWREAALSNARLWSSFSVCTTRGNVNQYERALPVWLERSAGASLTITVGFGVWLYGDDRKVDSSNILKLLIPHAHGERWQKVEFCLGPDALRTFISFPDLWTPSLEEFTIKHVYAPDFPRESGTSTAWSDSLFFLHRSPKLHDVSFFDDSGSPPLPSIAWNQLTALTFDSNDDNFFLVSIVCKDEPVLSKETQYYAQCKD